MKYPFAGVFIRCDPPEQERSALLQTSGNRIVQPKWVARNAILVVDLDELDFGELLEIVGQKISNIIRCACRCACAG